MTNKIESCWQKQTLSGHRSSLDVTWSSTSVDVNCTVTLHPWSSGPGWRRSCRDLLLSSDPWDFRRIPTLKRSRTQETSIELSLCPVSNLVVLTSDSDTSLRTIVPSSSPTDTDDRTSYPVTQDRSRTKMILSESRLQVSFQEMNIKIEKGFTHYRGRYETT